MALGRSTPVDLEAAFLPHEMFFSITDARGVIKDGNAVFCRIAQFERSELLGKPHSIIRHPDMPKAVFKLLWDTIQGGQPIGAYVKNMARDGTYYWVFACVFPVDGGYVSVRIKPTSDLWKAAIKVYQDTRNFERNHKIEESTHFLLEQLKGAGFATYPAFQGAALALELEGRAQMQPPASRGPDSASATDALSLVSSHCVRGAQSFGDVAGHLRVISASKGALNTDAGHVLALCNDLRLMSINLAITASRIGRAGAVLNEISRGFDRFSDQIQSRIVEFEQAIATVEAMIAEARDLVGFTQVQVEMVSFFVREVAESSDGLSREVLVAIDILLGLSIHYLEQVARAAERIQVEARSLDRSADALSKAILGLEIVRLSGKIEGAGAERLAAQLKGEFQALEQVILDVRGRIDHVLGEVKKIIQRSAETHQIVASIGEALRQARTTTQSLPTQE